MRELNEQELEQVAGGWGWTYTNGTSAQAVGALSAEHGFGISKTVTDSTQTAHFNNSYAANTTFVAGHDINATSGAGSSSGVSIQVG